MCGIHLYAGPLPGALSLQLRGGWQRLSAVRDANAFLAAVLRKPLHASLSALSANLGLHEVEGLLRTVYRRMVNEVADWMPTEWRPAVKCVTVLADLPAIQFLIKGGDAYAWMRDDTSLREYLPNPALQSDHAYASMQFAKFLKRESSVDSLVDIWVRYWHTLWPPMADAILKQLLGLEAIVMQGKQRLAEIKIQISQPEIDTTEREFIRIFRQQLQTPAAAFAYLGLSWLELARIRAGLLERRLAAPPT